MEKRYTNLVVWAELTRTNEQPLGFKGPLRGAQEMLLCRCDCSSLVLLVKESVVSGSVINCLGCKSALKGKGNSAKKDPTYLTWKAMKDRCKNHVKYVEKGIKVCKEWVSNFNAFFETMGEKPLGTSLDRIDNAKGYEPGNCRWATPKEQGQNKTGVTGFTFEGLTDTLNGWGKRLGYTNGVQIGRRLAKGWTLEKTLTTPVGKKSNTHCGKGHLLSPENLVSNGKKPKRCKMCIHLKYLRKKARQQASKSQESS